MPTAATALDVADLQRRVQAVYEQVAQEPRRAYHFEMGRELALRLGYPKDLRGRALVVPAGLGLSQRAHVEPGDRRRGARLRATTSGHVLRVAGGVRVEQCL